MQHFKKIFILINSIIRIRKKSGKKDILNPEYFINQYDLLIKDSILVITQKFQFQPLSRDKTETVLKILPFR